MRGIYGAAVAGWGLWLASAKSICQGREDCAELELKFYTFHFYGSGRQRGDKADEEFLESLKLGRRHFSSGVGCSREALVHVGMSESGIPDLLSEVVVWNKG